MSWRISIVVVWVAIFLGGCTTDIRHAENVPLIRSGGEMKVALDEVSKITVGPIERAELGEALTPQDEKDLRRASRLLQGVVKFQPDNYLAHFALGQIHYALGDYVVAIAALSECPKRAPDKLEGTSKETVARAFYLMSQSYIQVGAWEEADKAIEDAIKLVPISSDYYTGLAATKIQLKQYDKARAALEQALKLEPDHYKATSLKRLLIQEKKW